MRKYGNWCHGNFFVNNTPYNTYNDSPVSHFWLTGESIISVIGKIQITSKPEISGKVNVSGHIMRLFLHQCFIILNSKIDIIHPTPNIILNPISSRFIGHLLKDENMIHLKNDCILQIYDLRNKKLLWGTGPRKGASVARLALLSMNSTK